MVVLTICFTVALGPAHADSHGKFPGKGSIDAYAKPCDVGNKALEYSKKGDYETAIKCDREANAIYPFDSGGFHNLGNHLAKLGKYDEARKAQEQAIALEPNFVGAFLALGLTYEDQGKPADAERYYRKAVQMDPNDYECVFDLGDILRQEGKFGEARDWLIKAKACAPNARCQAQADRTLMKCDRKETSN